MYGYIYITTNLINGRKYIGRHKSSSYDSKYFGSGVALISALNKYGVENFDNHILESINDVPTICDSEEQLMASEKYYVKYYDAVDNDLYYNLVDGGAGSFPKGMAAWNKGLTKEDDRVKKYSENRKHTILKEHGYMWSNQEKAIKTKLEKYGCIVPLTEEQENLRRKHISESKKGKPSKLKGTHISEEHKEKISKKNGKKIICVETGKLYNSYRDVAKELGYKSTIMIYRACKDINKEIKGFHFKFA